MKAKSLSAIKQLKSYIPVTTSVRPKYGRIFFLRKVTKLKIHEYLVLKHENYHIYLTGFQPLIIINGWNSVRFLLDPPLLRRTVFEIWRFVVLLMLFCYVIL